MKRRVALGTLTGPTIYAAGPALAKMLPGQPAPTGQLLPVTDVADARAKGAEVIEVNPAGEDFAGSNGNKMPLTIVRNVTDDMKVMQEEIFGPILPVIPYRDMNSAITYVNSRPRPLALYIFDNNRCRVDQVLDATVSGGVTVNDTLLHIAQDNLPFGGVGETQILIRNQGDPLPDFLSLWLSLIDK